MENKYHDSKAPVDPGAPVASGSPVQTMAALLDGWKAWARDNSEAIKTTLAWLVPSLEDLKEHSNYSTLVQDSGIHALMQHGWYPHSGMSLGGISLLSQAFEEDPASANELLCDIFRSHLAAIERILGKAFSNREQILRDAFEAHHQGRYNLSVLAFLTQADGIVLDACSRNLFTRERKDAIEDLAKTAPDSLSRELVLTLSYEEWPLVLTSGKRPEAFVELNRHQVLHGEVTNYGTEENSLKAIALLHYLSTFAPHSTEQDEKRSLPPV